MEWDPGGLARRFAQEAARAKLYLDAIRPKLAVSVAHRLLHDEQLATVYVAHYLRRHACMDSRDALCRELREMHERPPAPPRDAFYPAAWPATWQRHVRWIHARVVDGALLRSVRRPPRSAPRDRRPAPERRA